MSATMVGFWLYLAEKLGGRFLLIKKEFCLFDGVATVLMAEGRC